MGYFVLAVLLLGIEVTRQFRHIPRDYRKRTNDDYVLCTIETLEKLRGEPSGNLRFYTSEISDSVTTLVIRNLFYMNPPMPLVISNPDQLSSNQIVPEKICLAVVNSMKLLLQVLDVLYRKIHHERCVICVTFRCFDPIKNLSTITEQVWISGVPRNIIFIVTDSDTEDIKIIGVPAYSRGNCLRTKLTEVGQYRKGKFHVYGTGLYPRLNDLGGCELSVMVQPPMLPYVERMEDSPGGVVGDFMDVIAASMNFTTKYAWSVRHDDMINHIYEKDLNLMIDMIPRASTPATNYRFSVGIVRVSFIVPRKKKKRMLNKLLEPFDKMTWLIIAIILSVLVILSLFVRGSDSTNILLKTFGSLLGVGVGRITATQGSWMKVFFWFWLLPAYILVQWYQARLTKDISIPIFEQEIRTLPDLATSQLDLMCSPSTKRGVCHLHEEVFGMICTKCRVASDEEIWSNFYPDLMKNGLMNNTSVIANFDLMEAHPAFLNAFAIEDYLMKVNQLAEVRPGSAWIFEIQEIWERIFASGLVHYWRRRYIDTTRRKAASTSIGLFQPGFGWCSFFLLMLGWIVSFGCFLVELMLHRFLNESTTGASVLGINFNRS